MGLRAQESRGLGSPGTGGARGQGLREAGLRVGRGLFSGGGVWGGRGASRLSSEMTYGTKEREELNQDHWFPCQLLADGEGA